MLYSKRPKRALWTVDKTTGCWNWNLSVFQTNGYGQYRRTMAHRWVYVQLGRTIPDGLVLDHLCRNIICVNPDHLEPVTDTENKRRGNVAKLGVEDIEKIRHAVFSDGRLYKDVAIEYGVSDRMIGVIVRGQGWTDMPGPTSKAAPRRWGKSGVTPEKILSAAELRRQGLTYAEIGKILDISKYRVYDILVREPRKAAATKCQN